MIGCPIHGSESGCYCCNEHDLPSWRELLCIVLAVLVFLALVCLPAYACSGGSP